MFIDCSERILGELSPAIIFNNHNRYNSLDEYRHPSGQLKSCDESQINNVVVPDYVLEELRKTGIPANWYNSGELWDAILACGYDRNLIDDEEGETFQDRLHFTEQEKLERARKKKSLRLCLSGEDCVP